MLQAPLIATPDWLRHAATFFFSPDTFHNSHTPMPPSAADVIDYAYAASVAA